MPIRYISFDLYGTLIRYNNLDEAWHGWQKTLYNYLVQHGAKVSANKFSALCHNFFSEEISPQKRLSVFESRIVRMAEQLDIQLSAKIATRIADDCCYRWQKSMSLDPDCIKTLKKLSTQYTLFLISNFDHPSHIHRILLDLKIKEYFQEILISSEQKINKPKAELAAEIKSKYQIKPYECIHIGDSIEDYQFAINSKMIPILLGKTKLVNGKIDYLANEKHVISQVRHVTSIKFVVDMINRLN